MMSDSDDPRENLITTAVNFLQNTKVRDSPLSTKRAFLEKKGLTKSEIDLAVERSGILEHVDLSSNVPQPYHGHPMAEQGQMMSYNHQIVPANSTWSKVRDFTALTIVVGGVGVAVYRLYHYVVKPYLFGTQQQSIEKQVLDMQAEMTRTLVKVQESLQAIQDTLKQQEERLQQLSIQAGAKKTEETLGRLQDSQFITDLKSEVTSIKGLLLNRRQFPPAPTTTPVLPSWQISKPSPITPGPSGDSEELQSDKVDPVSDEAFQLGGSQSDTSQLNGHVTESTGGHSDTPVSDLVMANKNDGSNYNTFSDRNVEENDELDPANQVIGDQTSSQLGVSESLPSAASAGTNGVLAQDDTTLEVVS